MATIKQRNSGLWQAQVRRKGYKTLSKSFGTKTEASKWAKAMETDMDRGLVAPVQADVMTLGEALDTYEQDITPTKKGAKQEYGVLRRIRLHAGDLLNQPLEAVRPAQLSQYRDKRLQQPSRTGRPVTGSTVCRELALLSHLYTVAVKVWGLELSNPIHKVQKPRENLARSRRVGEVEGASEFELICAYLPSVRVRMVFTLLVEMACRRGELVKLRWSDVDLPGRCAWLRDTKNGETRGVPLSLKAVEVLGYLELSQPEPGGLVVGYSGDYLSKAWQRAKMRAGVNGLRLHDLRREGVSRLFEAGLNTLEVSSISGHKSLQMLKRYTNLQTKNLILKLDQAQAQAHAQADTQAGSQAEVSHV